MPCLSCAIRGFDLCLSAQLEIDTSSIENVGVRMYESLRMYFLCLPIMWLRTPGFHGE